MPARAKLPPGEGKRTPLNMRTTRELRERLEREAADSGRSLAQEVEARLERSFAEEKSRAAISDEAVGGVYASFGKPETFLVARLLANAIHTIEAVTGKNWMDDPKAHRQTQEACKNILDAFRPPGGEGPMGIDLTFGESVGKDAAINALKSEFERVAHTAKFFDTKMKAG